MTSFDPLSVIFRPDYSSRLSRTMLVALIIKGMDMESIRATGVMFLALLTLSCSPGAHYDLAVTRARVFDVHTGNVSAESTILIRGGRIAEVLVDGDPARYTASTTLDAAGRLATPGLIDVHFHSGTILPDSLSMQPDSIRHYRDEFAEAYLPYGVTTVRSCGDSERWLPMLRDWTIGAPGSPDFFACGAAIISTGDHHFAGHVEVDGPDSARAKVRQYHDMGFRHLKVYWRLREPEFAAVMDEARKLGMNTTGHVDYRVVGVPRVMDLGLRWFEHAYTLGVEAIDSTGYAYVSSQLFLDHYERYISGRSVPGSFFISRIEVFNSLGENNPAMLRLIDSLKKQEAGVTPTLHVFAQRFGLTYFTTPSSKAGYDDTEVLADTALARCRDGYRIMGGYVYRLFTAGVPLTVGSDWADPGRACLSEMLLLHQCGLPMSDVLIAATLNGARQMGIDGDIGSIERGKKAHLVLFDEDPLLRPEGLLGGKTVIKDGVPFEQRQNAIRNLY